MVGVLLWALVIGKPPAGGVVPSVGVLTLFVLAMAWAHRTALRYANSYWMYVAQAIALALLGGRAKPVREGRSPERAPPS